MQPLSNKSKEKVLFPYKDVSFKIHKLEDEKSKIKFGYHLEEKLKKFNDEN